MPNTSMKAIVYEQFGGPLQVEQVPDPSPPRDGVVIAVKANGICRSDWHGWMGHDPDIRLPHVPGHELAGIVQETGPEVRRWKQGDRVTVPFAVGCGGCPQCLSGNQQICDDYFQPGFTAWGSFAEYVAIPHAEMNLVRLPDGLDDVASASLGCRFVTAFRAVVVQGRVAPGEWVAIHGCGGLGLAAVMIAVAAGAQVIAVDINEEALECASGFGAVRTLNARKTPDLPRVIGDLTFGGAAVSIDALGARETCRNSVLCLAKRGRHVQAGLMLADEREVSLPMAQVIARELEIVGSHGMPAHAYAPLLKMICENRLQPRQLVRKTVPLEQAPAELRAMGSFGLVGVTVIDRF
jgi:alcohol dehydrogenase